MPVDKKKWIIIFVAAILVYLSVLPNQFAYDDIYLVKQNRIIRSLDNIPQMFVSDYLWWGALDGKNFSGSYRPVVILSFALNYAVHGLKPFGYHLIDVLLHAINSILIYFLARNFFPRQNWAAFLTGLFFALHPVHTEAVANAVGRAELLFCLFYLLALGLHLKIKSLPEEKQTPIVLSVLILLLLSLFSKEMSITFVAIAFLSDLIISPGLSFKHLLHILCKNWKIYAAYAFLTIVFFIFRASLVPMTVNVSSLSNPLITLDPFLRILNASYILFYKYVFLLLWPQHLSPDYSYNAISLFGSIFNLRSLLTMATIITVVIGLVWSWKRNRLIFFGAVFFFITISPVANIAKPIVTIMGERLLYLPSFGFCLISGFLLSKLLATQKYKILGWIIVFLISGYYAGRTVVRNFDWHDNATLFGQALKVVPNSAKVRYMMAEVYLKENNDPQKALTEYQKAVEIYPDYYFAHQRIGYIFASNNRFGPAIESFKKSLRIAPFFDNARFCLASAYYIQGEADSARFHYRILSGKQMPRPQVYIDLGLIYWQSGQADSALHYWQKGLKINTGNPKLQKLISAAANNIQIPGRLEK